MNSSTGSPPRLASAGLDINTSEIRGKPIVFGTASLSIGGGKSAYAYAREHGYIGTEKEFGELMARLQPEDGLESSDTDRPLSANQGRVLKEEIEQIKYWYKLNDD